MSDATIGRIAISRSFRRGCLLLMPESSLTLSRKIRSASSAPSENSFTTAKTERRATEWRIAGRAATQSSF